MAELCWASNKRLAIVARNRVMGTRFSSRTVGAVPVGAAVAGAGAGAAGLFLGG